MILLNIYNHEEKWKILYELLAEREPIESISHRKMPTLEQHLAFVRSKPYKSWYFVVNQQGEIVGGAYLSRTREIGVSIFRKYRRMGYAKAAISQIMHMYPGKVLANINPGNEASINLFKKFGFRHIQNTYEKE